MNRIKIIFGARIDGIEFPEISFADTNLLYKNITLVLADQHSYRYEIIVTKNVVYLVGDELKNIVNEAYSEAQSFVYAFSLAADVKIFEFACKGYIQNESFIEISQIFGSDGMRSFANPTVKVGQPRVDKIKEDMKRNFDMSNLQMFFEAVTIEEPIGRFISLYTLMLHHCDDNQRKVDEAIMTVDSTVAHFPSPQGRFCETVFTKLRNELSHKRDGVSMIDTHQKVRANVQRFEHIVKTYVLRMD